MEDRIVVNRRRLAVAITVAAMLAGLWQVAAVWRSEAPYTALVVDSRTGKPVEGAVVLAIWWKNVWGKKVWFEGPSTVMRRYWEGRTGPDGRVVVPRFWRRRLFGEGPSLSVYKPGYVLWNRTWVFPDYAERADFDRRHRTVRLEPWQPQFSCLDHRRFIENCSSWDLYEEPYGSGKRTFFHEVERYEEPRCNEERSK
jgi:hypothetical protein